MRTVVFCFTGECRHLLEFEKEPQDIMYTFNTINAILVVIKKYLDFSKIKTPECDESKENLDHDNFLSNNESLRNNAPTNENKKPSVIKRFLNIFKKN